MKKISKKILSTVLAVAMLLSVAVSGDGFASLISTFAVNAAAEDETYSFDSTTGILTITAECDMEEDNSWLQYANNATMVVFESGITSIPAYAFNSFYVLRLVKFPASLETIGNGAFRNSNIVKVYYEGTAEDKADITINSENESLSNATWVYGCVEACTYTFDSTTNTLRISGNGPMYDFNYTSCVWSEYANSAQFVVIENGVTSISSYAFAEFHSLLSIRIPKSVTSVEDNAFHGTGFSTVYYGGTATDKEAMTISGTNNETLSSATWLYGYEEECTCTFDSETGILTITGKGPMYNYNVTPCPWSQYANSTNYVVISRGVTSIGAYAFTNFNSIQNITIPKTLKAVDDYAFHHSYIYGVTYEGSAEDRALITVGEIENDILDYVDWSYNYVYTEPCTCSFNSETGVLTVSGLGPMTNYGLTACPWSEYSETATSVVIESGITSISSFSFCNFEALESIVIPATVTSIEECAFTHDYNLSTVYYAGSPTDKEAMTIHEADNEALVDDATWYYYYVPSVEITCSFDISTRVLYVYGAGFMEDGINWEEGLPWNEYSDIINHIVIADGITSICQYAFSECYSLVSIRLPKSITRIAEGAFLSSSVETINYKGTEEDKAYITVESETGNECLTNATWNYSYDDKIFATYTFDEATKVLTIFGNGVMYDYGDLNDPYASAPWVSYRNEATSIVVSEGITGIGTNAFSGFSNVTSVTLPTSLTAIGDNAFGGCSSLTGLTLPTTITTLGENAFSGVENTITYLGCEAEWQEIAGYNTCGATNIAFSYIAKGTCGDNAMWKLSLDNVLAVYGSGAMYDYENNTDRPYDSYAASVTKIQVLGDITSIGKRAFDSFTACTSYDIQAPVTSIGQWAFGTNKAMTEFTVPETVTTIGNAAFGTCTNLVTFTFSSNVTAVPQNCFEADTALTTVTLPSGLTSIGKQAFRNCSALTGLSLPKSLTSLGENAFSDITNTIKFLGSESEWQAITGYDICGATDIQFVNRSGTFGEGGMWYLDTATKTLTISCTGAMPNFSSGATPWQAEKGNFTKVVINEGVTTIGNNAFNGFSSVNSYSLPSTLTSIGSYAMNGNSALKSITLPENLQTISDHAFACCSLQSISVPDSVTNMEAHVFYRNEWTLKSAKLPKNMKTIKCGLFQECYALASITLPENLETIEAYAFLFCHFNSITFPDTLKSIYGEAFRQSHIVNLVLPDNLTYIAGSAFSQDDYMKSVKLPKNLTSIPNTLFYHCDNLETIIWPDNLKSIGNDVFNKTGLTSVTVPESVTSIGTSAFANCTKLTEITLPSGINTINTSMFSGDTALTTVNVPSAVKTISSSAFKNCSALTSLTLPEGVTTIGEYAFDGCAALTGLTLPEDITTINQYTFNGCTALASINIPTGVTSIGKNAFSGCASLTGLTIPSGVTTLGENSFNGVTNTITYDGTDSEWYSISGSDVCAATNMAFNYFVVTFNSDEHGTAPEKQKILKGQTATETTMETVPGYIFGYWHTNESSETAFDFSTPITENTMLFAKWNACEHSWSHWVTIENASATKTGLMRRTCSICGEVEERVIPKYIPDYPTSITLDKTSLVLSFVDVETLTATVYPDTAINKNVVWESSNTRVAKVVDGVVYSLAPGYAVITASTVDDRYPICQATCTVHVVAISTLSTESYIDNELNLISGIAPKLDSLSDYISVIDGCSLEYSTDTIGTGTKVDIIQNGEVVDTYTTMVYGDVNGDGIYDGMDAMIVNCIVNGMLTREQVGDAVWLAADCNHDGVIDNLDVEILNNAGLLLAQVDQSASEEELETDSVYQEYLSLIDQSPVVEEEAETTPTEEPVEEETAESFFTTIIALFSKLINYLMSLINTII